MDKVVTSPDDAVADIRSGSPIAVGGFGLFRRLLVEGVVSRTGAPLVPAFD